MRRRVAVDRQWGQAGASVIENDRICSKCSEQCVQVNSYRGMAGHRVSGPREPVPGWDWTGFPHSTAFGQNESRGKYIENELDRCISRTDGKWGKPSAFGGAWKPFSLVGSRPLVDSGHGRQWGKLTESWGKRGERMGITQGPMGKTRFLCEISGAGPRRVFPIPAQVIPTFSPLIAELSPFIPHTPTGAHSR